MLNVAEPVFVRFIPRSVPPIARSENVKFTFVPEAESAVHPVAVLSVDEVPMRLD